MVDLAICGSEMTPDMEWQLTNGAYFGVPDTVLLFPYPSFNGILHATYDVNCPVSPAVLGNAPPRIVAGLNIDPLDNLGNSSGRSVHNPQGRDQQGTSSKVCDSCARLVLNTQRKSGRDDKPCIVWDVLPNTKVNFRYVGGASGYDGAGAPRVAQIDGIWEYESPDPQGCLTAGVRQAAIDNGEGDNIDLIEALFGYKLDCPPDVSTTVQWPGLVGPGGDPNWRKPRRPLSTTIL